MRGARGSSDGEDRGGKRRAGDPLLIFKALAVLLVVGLFLVPLVGSLDRQPGWLLQTRVGPARVGGQGFTRFALAVAHWARDLASEPWRPATPFSRLHRWAPVLGLAVVLSAFAVVPFAGRYTAGEVEMKGVVADVEMGLPLALAALLVTSVLRVAAAWSSGSAAGVLGGLREAARVVSSHSLALLALLPLVMVHGTLRPSALLEAQDRTFSLARLIAAFAPGFDPETWLPGASPSLAQLPLPAWGIIVNPLAFVVFTFLLLVAIGRAPFDCAEDTPELGAGASSGRRGFELALWRLSADAQFVLVAAWVVVLFLGGPAVPYLDQARIEGAIEGVLGGGFAALACAALHGLVFAVKLVVTMQLLAVIGFSLPRLRHDQITSMCWRRALPLAVLNILLTGAVTLALLGVG